MLMIVFHRVERYLPRDGYPLLMSPFEDLPSDQRAALRLALSGRNYSEIADALAISSESVAALAREAVTALAGASANALTTAEQARVADWITGAAADEPLVESSPAGRAIVEGVHSQLVGIEGIDLRSLPSEPSSGPAPAPAKNWEQTRPAKPAVTTATPSAPKVAPSSSASEGAPNGKGGYLLIGAAIVAIGFGGLAIAGVFNGSDSTTTSKPAQTKPTTNSGSQQNSGTTQSGWKLTRRFTLTPVAGSAGAGIGGLETKDGQQALLIAGTRMKPSTVVGIWLTGGPSPVLVGFQKVSAKGEFSAIGAVPKGAESADRLIVTSERTKPGQKPPAAPGQVLLTSPFSL